MKEVKIGQQIWMTENLNVDQFRNGDSIPEAKTEEEWNRAGEAKQPAWCYYENDPVNGAKYGILYNWYAVNDSRGLAPEGWKIPSDEDWSRLADFLGGEDVAGKKMKYTDFWADNEGKSGNGTNESGFSGVPGGDRSGSGFFVKFGFIGHYGNWWSSNEEDSDRAWKCELNCYNCGVIRIFEYKTYGLSVRCLRDQNLFDSFDNLIIYHVRLSEEEIIQIE